MKQRRKIPQYDVYVFSDIDVDDGTYITLKQINVAFHQICCRWHNFIASSVAYGTDWCIY